MPINVTWDETEKTMLVWRFEVPWTWAEYHAALEKSKSMLETVDKATMLIIATKGPRTTTPAGPSLQNFRAGFAILRPKVDRFVLVYGSMFARTLIMTLSRVNPSLRGVVFLSNSIEDGKQILLEKPKAKKAVTL
jgi:hypothetical protein